MAKTFKTNEEIRVEFVQQLETGNPFIAQTVDFTNTEGVAGKHILIVQRVFTGRSIEIAQRKNVSNVRRFIFWNLTGEGLAHVEKQLANPNPRYRLIKQQLTPYNSAGKIIKSLLDENGSLREPLLVGDNYRKTTEGLPVYQTIELIDRTVNSMSDSIIENLLPMSKEEFQLFKQNIGINEVPVAQPKVNLEA